MKARIKKHLAWLIDQLLCLFVSFITGVRPKRAAALPFGTQQKVYYANHGSHGDFVLVWISLPRRWRIHTRPVAGADYWLTGRFKSFIIQNVFNALLIARNSDNPREITEQMRAALEAGAFAAFRARVAAEYVDRTPEHEARDREGDGS